MTVVRLGADELLLHSPVPVDDALAAELAELGEVAHILAPNRWHHLHVKAAARRYPTAAVWGAPGLAQKRSDVAFTGVLGVDTPAAWGDDLCQVLVEGAPMVNEVVTLHRPSRSLVVTDLVFNINDVKGWGTPLVLFLVGGGRGLFHSRSWRWIFVRDRSRAGASAAEILSWDFDRVVPCHGDVVEAGARAALADRLAYLSPTPALR